MYKTLKIIRIVLAALMLFAITALILDATDGAVLRHWLGWMPKIQILPAILALNVVVILGIILVNFLIGRLYCSVVCPMGIFQDIFIWFHRIIFGKKRPYRYRKPQNWVRYTVLVLFVILMVLGLNGIGPRALDCHCHAMLHRRDEFHVWPSVVQHHLPDGYTDGFRQWTFALRRSHRPREMRRLWQVRETLQGQLY